MLHGLSVWGLGLSMTFGFMVQNIGFMVQNLGLKAQN
jgi:hypothetical protein